MFPHGQEMRKGGKEKEMQSADTAGVVLYKALHYEKHLLLQKSLDGRLKRQQNVKIVDARPFNYW